MKESFAISHVSRADLEGLGFDTSEVSDGTMERLASKLGDDYCEQLFWTSLKIWAEDYFEIPKRPLDMKGRFLHGGDKVIWYDPDVKHRDLQRVWTVDSISEELITIFDEFSEAEVFPNELKIVE